MATKGNVYGEILSTPQSQPIPGRESEMTPNNAGGHTFMASDWTQLRRFLILGSDGGTYYVDAKTLTEENAQVVLRCAAQNPSRTANMILEVSTEGQAFRNDAASFALALMLARGGPETRVCAWHAFSMGVIRTGRQFLEFVSLCKQLGVKNNRARRRNLGNWYTGKSMRDLAYQTIKYQTGGDWSHRDVLRSIHAKPEDSSEEAMLRYLVRGEVTDEVSELVLVWEQMKRAGAEEEVANLIDAHKLTWEFVPGQWQGKRSVWASLLPNLPYTAALRNLGRMGAYKLLVHGSDGEKDIINKLTDREGMRRARVHPLSILNALRVYQQGRGDKGNLTWDVNRHIASALEAAFYHAFDYVEASGKSFLYGLDVSGSMTSPIMGRMPFTCLEMTAVLALCGMHSEEHVRVMAFSKGFHSLPYSRHMRLSEAINLVQRLPHMGTDCALPMLYAIKHKLMDIDEFVVITDNETWAGGIQPSQALDQYRQRSGRPAKLIVVAMASNGFSIADPKDEGMLDIVGMSTDVPRLITQFATGL